VSPALPAGLSGTDVATTPAAPNYYENFCMEEKRTMRTRIFRQEKSFHENSRQDAPHITINPDMP
jgi:hypothetical protein